MWRILWINLLLLIQVNSFSAGVTLAWDAPTITNGLASYKLYAATNSLASGTNLGSALVTLSIPYTTTQSVIEFKNAARWYFVVTSVGTNSLESTVSNEVIIQAPPPLIGLRTIAVMAAPTLTGTNWVDVGFFQIRLLP